MDYKARFYSPSLGRFIQPDTIIPGVADPQSWNRYSYVQNRPINLNDPSGHDGIPTWLSNMTPNTLLIGVQGLGAAIFGLDVEPMIAVDLRPFKTFVENAQIPTMGQDVKKLWNSANAAFYLNGSLSAGKQAGAKVDVLNIGVTNTTIENLRDFDHIFRGNKVTGHAFGCWEICVGAEATLDRRDPKVLNTVKFQIGVSLTQVAGGWGVNLLDFSDSIAAFDTNGWKKPPHVPIFNKDYLNFVKKEIQTDLNKLKKIMD